ncbi:hypothetical protein PF008_g26937 [Phytophthora fragariae]|uniref:Secreted protein n=1 Tax=Phytophthora fragariae TaxID=53985 RepID=A0A6G0QFM4_9STRA|nr:hypothetical protein PF008_g26937 [Phytophthora fragariae]
MAGLVLRWGTGYLVALLRAQIWLCTGGPPAVTRSPFTAPLSVGVWRRSCGGPVCDATCPVSGPWRGQHMQRLCPRRRRSRVLRPLG